MDGKRTVLITGANTGIGYETVRALWASRSAYHIILAGRSADKVSTAISELQSTPSGSGNSTLEPLTLDISSDASIAAAFAHVQASHSHIDVLINNAGISPDADLGAGRLNMREAWNMAWDTNVAGTQCMTYTFAPLLVAVDHKSEGENARPDRRLLFVTSGLSSLIEEAERSSPAEARRPMIPAGWPKPGVLAKGMFQSYQASKTGMNMMFLQWVRLLEPDGVKCFNISPGLLATTLGGNREMLKKMGAGDPSIGGEFIRDVVEGLRDGDKGRAIRRDMVQPW